MLKVALDIGLSREKNRNWKSIFIFDIQRVFHIYVRSPLFVQCRLYWYTKKRKGKILNFSENLCFTSKIINICKNKIHFWQIHDFSSFSAEYFSLKEDTVQNKGKFGCHRFKELFWKFLSPLVMVNALLWHPVHLCTS